MSRDLRSLLLAVVWVPVLLPAGSAAAVPPVPFASIAEPAAVGGGYEVAVDGLLPGDRLILAGEAAAKMAPFASGLAWRAAPTGDGVTAWEAVAGYDELSVLRLELALLPPGQQLQLTVERDLADGSRAQVYRAVHRQDDGLLLLGPQTSVRIRRQMVITPTPEQATLGLVPDGQGHLKVAESDPRLPVLLAGAIRIRPCVSVTAHSSGGWKVLDSVSGNQTFDQAINKSCPNYIGTSIHINSAPAGAVISSIDLHYRVLHPGGLDEFKVAIFYDETYYQVLYGGLGNPGETTLEVDSPNMPLFTGRAVNAKYTLGACAINAITPGAYLDSWSATIFYDPADVDLVAGSLTVSPGSVAAGGNISIAYDGQVTGSDSTGGSYILGFYLSGDSNITTGDTLLAQVTESNATDPGDTFSSAGYSVQIPPGTVPDSYYIGMIVDVAEAVDETDDGNNIAWDELTVTAAQNIDLVAVSVTTATSSVQAGSSLSVSYAGNVAGSGTVGSSFVVGLYLSPDSNITTSDTLLGQRTESSATNPGDTFGATLSVTIPGSTAAGTYHLGVIIDTTGAVTESSEGNNKASSQLTITSGGGATIDLVAACVSVADDSVLPGQRLTVSYLGMVSGSGTVGGVFPSRIYLSSDSNVTTADTALWGIPDISVSNPGDTFSSSSLSFTLPAATAPGEYYLGLLVDWPDWIDEADESNNAVAVPLTVLSGVLYIPAAAHAAGVGGSQWRTDLELKGLGGGAGFSIALLEKGRNNNNPQEVVSSVSAGWTKRYNDVVSSLFSFDGSAALRITPTSGQLFATSRTYNDDPAGTYGQYIPAYPEHEAIRHPQEATIIQLSRSATLGTGYRTNIGFVNAGGTWMTIKVRLLLANGITLGTLSYDLKPYEHNQVTDIFGEVTSGAVNSGYAVVWTTTPDAAFFAYASVVDNRSGDAVYLPAKVEALAK